MLLTSLNESQISESIDCRFTPNRSSILRPGSVACEQTGLSVPDDKWLCFNIVVSVLPALFFTKEAKSKYDIFSCPEIENDLAKNAN